MMDERAEAVATRVLAIVRDLAKDLQPRKSVPLDVRPDSDLERDLGLDSLGRAELLHRLEREFRIRLSERLLAEAATPIDLVKGVLAAKPADVIAAELAPTPQPELPEIVEPTRAATLLDALGAHVRAHPSRPHLHLWLSDDEEETFTYAELDGRARTAAAGLMAAGLEPGSRVAIMLPTEAEFFAAFFAVLMAGGIPVPVYPPFRRAQVEEHLRRQAGILRNAQACMLITDQRIRPLGHTAERAGRRSAIDHDRRRLSANGSFDHSVAGLGRDDRAHPVHFRQHRRSQGCRSHPRQPARQHSRHGRGHAGDVS